MKAYYRASDHSRKTEQMHTLHDELIKILEGENLTPHFQPIISLTQKKIIGYEALIRGPSDSPLYAPLVLFRIAHQFNLRSRLEFICRETTLRHYASLNINEKLFINVSPQVLVQPDFKKQMTEGFLDHFGLDPQAVVIEITEHQSTDNYLLMREAVDNCRNIGFEIALDDLGAGYSGLRLWSEVLPNYVKLDKHFIENLHNDPIKLNFVSSIQDIAHSLNCNVIAEGVETEAEYNAIVKLGINFVQGFYFARPTAIPLEKIDATLFTPQPLNQPLSITGPSTPVFHIAKMIPPVSSETTIGEVMNLFQSDNELTILPLVDNNFASGIILRDRFLSKLFSSRYGLELYGRKPIKLFVNKTPINIDQNTSIESASQQLTASMGNESAFIVTNNGQYLGVGTILDLLEEITRQQIHNAKHANPLTLLPGSVHINGYINTLLTNNETFTVAYFDLDNFKPFNDVYGYNAGDEIIKLVASILVEQFALSACKGEIGHIGGDDFIVVFTGNNWLEYCENVLTTFAKIIPDYYKCEDKLAGGIYTENRLGEKCFYPLISLSIGIIDPTSTSQCQSHVEIADLAAGAKKRAKNIEGNSFFVNKRNES